MILTLNLFGSNVGMPHCDAHNLPVGRNEARQFVLVENNQPEIGNEHSGLLCYFCYFISSFCQFSSERWFHFEPTAQLIAVVKTEGQK